MREKHDLITVIKFNEFINMFNKFINVFNEIMMNNRSQCEVIKILIS